MVKISNATAANTATQDTDEWVGMYYQMLLARTISERMWVLVKQGRVNFIVTCEGHEAAQVGSAATLNSDGDWLVPYYRDIAAVLVRGMTPRDIMLGAFARAADPSSGGRQMPCHFGSRSLRILSGSSVVATQITHAAGIAMAAKLKGERSVTLVYFGDGASSRGEFHEGLNFAGVHRLPVVFFCESNGYGISTPIQKQVAGGDIAARAAGYGFPGVVVDGSDVLGVKEVTQEAVNRARAGGGPTLIEAKIFRLMPHTSHDDDTRYRTREEVELGHERDPVLISERQLREAGHLSAAQIEELRGRALAEVSEAVLEAERSPLPAGEQALDHVYGN